jgi:hypothetical protein
VVGLSLWQNLPKIMEPRVSVAPSQSGSLCYWVVIEGTEKFPGTKSGLQKLQLILFY